MASKCVHKGCGKEFTDADEPCVYHPGPPVFHEGQKGWKCCKPRVLTFDEFLAIPPCTTGKHSTVDDTPVEPPKPAAEVPSPAATPVPSAAAAAPPRPVNSPAIPPPSNAPTPVPEEPESDDPELAIPANATCRRRGCNAGYDANVSRDEEKCVYHPGQPIFHEGSKGWSCCKKRVLEFDEFLKIQGCSEKKKHLFVGKGKPAGEEKVESVRNDFYQTASSVNVSLYLKKINKDTAKVEFKATSIELDLPTTDNKRYTDSYELFAPIDPEQSKFRVLGTKLELTLVKADGTSWPVLRRDDKWSGERIQIGNAGRV
ncbi:cysteine and histidine-rich domain-containing protein [Aspergillus vadensis CBS 113365]|uniref:CORD and CS domain protein n=1 Tax=Aspergillus vadensis (strain CBS 113365 / IMI 142717 / IBT 24658) TaxID=1448311 RepID=A0A319B6U1_ASPVC|nr:CORD and CS domain protein [Aspergillus vadensis CBS 113365]PYH68195.1 CORD and CS domain protein [Aspergillus vadensis CBS 113365]